jgi:PiT family inorganic phosphate transporter
LGIGVTEVVLGAFIMGFTLFSGINDGGNLVGTYLATPNIRAAVVLPALAVSILLGPLLFGTAVSHTIAVEVVDFQRASHAILVYALVAAVATLAVTWRLRIPTSTTLALAGGMIGAAWAGGASQWIHWQGLVKIGAGLVGSVLIGFAVAFLLSSGVWRLLQQFPPLGFMAGKLQYLTIVFQGVAYGANDQEKAIGLMALWFMIWTHSHRYAVHWPAVVIAWSIWLLGLSVGGLYIAKTVSGHVFRLRGVDAVTTQLAAALTVSSAAMLGLPVSTTQTTDGSLFGTGTALKPYRVRWRTVAAFLKVWVWTLPVSIALGVVMTGTARLIGVLGHHV